MPTLVLLTLLVTLLLAATADAYPLRVKPHGWVDNHLQGFRLHVNDLRRDKCLRAYRFKFTAAELAAASDLIRERARVTYKRRHLRAPLEPNRCIPRDPVGVIRYVFGAYGDQAVAVAACESGFSVNAVNGQYLGLFQMGSWERATYGHGATALEQARAAYRYFVASGRDWSPWACKP